MSSFEHVWGTAARSAPAFPSAPKPPNQLGMDIQPAQHPGLSIWQYYAAHAPAIPNWFMPEDENDGIPSTHGLNEFHKRQLELVLADALDRSDADQEVQRFLVKFDEARIGKPAAKRKALERRFFSWRKYYADMMVHYGSEQP